MISSRRSTRDEAQILLKGLFADDEALQRADAWAQDVLQQAGIDPASQKMRAIARLRRAEPRMSLATAVLLLDRVTGRDRPPRRRRNNPLLR